MGSRPIFWKALKFPIYQYFLRLNRVILNQLKKIKKCIEKSKIIFFGSRFGYRWEVGTFSEGLKIPNLSIFLSDWSDNIKSVKKNKEQYRKIANNFFRFWVWRSGVCSSFSERTYNSLSIHIFVGLIG